MYLGPWGQLLHSMCRKDGVIVPELRDGYLGQQTGTICSRQKKKLQCLHSLQEQPQCFSAARSWPLLGKVLLCWWHLHARFLDPSKLQCSLTENTKTQSYVQSVSHQLQHTHPKCMFETSTHNISDAVHFSLCRHSTTNTNPWLRSHSHL